MASLRVFVSHSHADNSWCDGFVDELKNRGLDVWYDRQGLYVGAQWVATIEKELQGRDVFLIVLTPDSLASQWVQREFSLALAQNKQIIGVLHRPAALGGFLTTYQLLDATRLDLKQAAQTVAAALAGTKPLPPPPSPPPQPVSTPPVATKPPRNRVDGEWASEGDHKVELFLNQYEVKGTRPVQTYTYTGSPQWTSEQFTATHISGTGNHWLCGSVTITGSMSKASVTLKLTPAGKGAISHIEMNLTLLPSGKMKGHEIAHEYEFRKGGFADSTFVKGTMNLTFEPVDD